MSVIFPEIDPEGLLEYSVVFSDRSLNHMSALFRDGVRDLSQDLRATYGADHLIILPGGGTFAMEAVARQFADNKRSLIIRNGWFSYRWSQIFEMAGQAENTLVLKAKVTEPVAQMPFAPPSVAEVVAAIHTFKPEVVFAAHVETSAGIILPDGYIESVASATHAVGGIFVLDCVASGAVWVDMKSLGIDVLLTAPQKGWSASPGFGLIFLAQEAHARLEKSQSRSFAMDLKRWLQIIKTYESGGHAYHATLPTEAIIRLRQMVVEAKKIGLATLADRQWELGRAVRSLMQTHGYPSVAAPGYEAPGVVVSYCEDEAIQKGTMFSQVGIQSAAGVPLMCDESPDFRTFRIGLFGLDKLLHVERTVALLANGLEKIRATHTQSSRQK